MKVTSILKNLAKCGIIFGTTSNIYRLFSAVGGNKTLWSRICTILLGVGMSSIPIGAFNKSVQTVNDILKEFAEELDKEQEETLEDSENDDSTDYIIVNGKKYFEKKEVADDGESVSPDSSRP